MRRAIANREILGLLVLVTAGAVLFVAVARPQMPWQEPYRVHAVVTSAETLAKGAPVRIAGVDVGKVEKVERGPGSLNTVTFVVRDAGRPVHQDAELKLRPRLFLEGNLFVDLRPGTPGAGELRSGGTIPVTQTAVPVRLDDVLSILRADTRDQLRSTLDEYATALDGETARTLNRSLPAWRPALARTAIVADAAHGRRAGDLAAWVRDQGRAADAVARHERDLRDLVGGYAATLAVLGDRRIELAATIRGLARTARAAVPAARDLRRALPAVRRFARDLRPALRRAPSTLRATLPFLDEADRLLRPERLPGLARDLRPTARSLAAIQPRLVDLFGRVTPVSRCVRTHVLPVLESKLDDGHLSTGLPVWRELLHTAPGLTSASQNFDGNGPMLRYVLGVGDVSLSLGELPGVGEVVARTHKPITGSRPPAPPRIPPYRPDVPCESQRLPDLHADAVPPAPAVASATRAPNEAEQRLFQDLRDAAASALRRSIRGRRTR